jgi:2'-5' RNA ligase
VLTIGVSIAVPDPIGAELQARRESFGDDLARAIPTHVTLLPPTDVEEESLDAVSEHLQRTSQGQRPFTVRLHGTGSFRPTSPVVFVRLAAGQGACARLQRAIRRGPLRRSLDFAYHPHVTVAHHLSDAALDRAYTELGSYRASFQVGSFGLYLHGPDRVWRLARTYRFAAPASLAHEEAV